MNSSCESIQNALIDFVGESEGMLPELQLHLKSCGGCRDVLKVFQSVHSSYQKLPEIEVPPHLSQKTLSTLIGLSSQAKDHVERAGLFSRLSSFLLQPGLVAAVVFIMVLGGVSFYRDRISPSPQMAQNFTSIPPLSPQEDITDLEASVLAHADLATLEQVSTDGVAAFKHQLALRHLMDGEDLQASQVLHNIMEQDLDYSQWEQVVKLHMKLMKKMGREAEYQKDLLRFREYAVVSLDSSF